MRVRVCSSSRSAPDASAGCWLLPTPTATEHSPARSGCGSFALMMVSRVAITGLTCDARHICQKAEHLVLLRAAAFAPAGLMAAAPWPACEDGTGGPPLTNSQPRLGRVRSPSGR